MAARLAGYTTTTAVFGGTKIVKVRQWQAYSEPSDTYFEIRARQVTTRAQVQGIADEFSATIEQLLSFPQITDISWAQDVTAGGQLIGVYTVYWTLEAADESGFEEFPASQFTVDAVLALVPVDAAPAGLPPIH